MPSETPGTARRALFRQLALSLIAAALVAASLGLPFWTVELSAPQYPHGLRMIAYGTEIRGDLREINIINHYVGMEHIDTVPAPEMSLFVPAIAALVVLSLAAPLHRRVAQLAILAVGVTPLVVLVDLQRWLHRFGRNLDPKAPIRVEPFTPLAIGKSKIGNFESFSMVSWGFVALVVAAGLLYLGLRLRHGRPRQAGDPAQAGAARAVAVTAAATLLAAAVWAAAPADGGPGVGRDLQARIDAAPDGATVTVPAGLSSGPVRIGRPLTVIGEEGAVIDGGGRGSVVEITGHGVTFRGFTVRNSGRNVSEEPAGIRVEGSGHRIEGNRVEEVYFGIHLSAGRDNLVRGNVVRPGEEGGVRPGHAVSLWHQSGSRIVGNRIEDARDGIYLSFADDLLVRGNRVTGCRYGVHSMYSESSVFEDNRLEDNLLGAALMYSNRLSMRCNEIRNHRRGATAYGLLLKDIDDLVFEGNVVAGNRVGIYADSTPLGPGHEALVRGNLLLGNHSALALQSNVALTFYDNRVIGNLIDVRPEGRGLSAASRWSVDGRGNHWDGYQGYDADGDGVGDLPYRYEQVMLELIERAPLAQAFVYTPASLALERAARLFPLYRPDPLLVDPRPLMRPDEPFDSAGLDCREGGP
jgi:nitrous oxidase accessory protein